eukprot:UN32364
MPMAAHARDWTSKEVAQWISSLSLKGPGSVEVPRIFATNEIDGQDLFKEIDDETLEALEISFLHRKKIMRSLQNLIASVEERESWTKNSPVEVFSNKNEKWCTGSVVHVFVDSEGEWLEIGYGNLSKQVQRYCEDIRPSRQQIEKRIRKKIT